MDAQEIISLLNERAEDFCRWLFPAGRRNGSFWEIGDINGNAGDSLRIHIAGEMVGIWADHGAGEDAKGATLVHLLMRKRGTTVWTKTLVEVKEWLGLEISSAEDRAFREQQRNGGHFETAAKNYAKLNPDGPVFRYLTEERKLGPAILSQYRVCEHKEQAAMCFAQVTDSKRAVVFAKYVAIQRAPDGKKREWSDPKGAHPGLWGKYAVDSENGEVVITEGKIDALSIAELGFDAVSMPNGAKNDDWIERDWRWLEQFRSIILCFDQDDAGATGLEKSYPKLIARLGRHRCRIVHLPEGIKDPNDALRQGRQEELMVAVSGAQSIDPESLANASEYREEVEEVFFPPDGAPEGLAIPWTHMLRLRPGEVTLWTGINSHGKTTMLLHCIAHLTQEHRERVIIASMEAPCMSNRV